jgi:hypothetical protein
MKLKTPEQDSFSNFVVSFLPPVQMARREIFSHKQSTVISSADLTGSVINISTRAKYVCTAIAAAADSCIPSAYAIFNCSATWRVRIKGPIHRRNDDRTKLTEFARRTCGVIVSSRLAARQI